MPVLCELCICAKKVMFAIFLAASVYSVIAHSLYSSCFKNYSLLKSVEMLIMPELGLFIAHVS